MSESLRLFWAIELNQEVRDSLGQLIKEFKPTGADVRWVRPGAIHLTIKFL
ncbi:MAG: RNA 2',3'-cyclic phosphodiesterase, partial [Deltaproteobacteria bacterium]|nr:RNA 2',3'-cyclic phosphodiesterase [Deltaproteobacteria bacterium]